MIEFPYLPYGTSEKAFPDCRVIKRPVIPIRLNDKNGTLMKYLALLDSGADHCIFHASIGEAMGLHVKKGKIYEYEGIEGELLLSYVHKIKLYIGSLQVKLYCGFSEDFDKQGILYGLLGQQGFFDKFDITFCYQKNIVQISKARQEKSHSKIITP